MKKETMNFNQHKEEYVEGFGGNKGKEEIM